MPTSVTMPALGESVTEGTVTRWLKQEGEQVEVDEPLLEVSTDKVDTEIPSPVAGVLTKILVAEDETVEVGAELAVIGGGDGRFHINAAPTTTAALARAPTLNFSSSLAKMPTVPSAVTKGQIDVSATRKISSGSPSAVDDIEDDLLRLVFTACHPVLSTEARVVLPDGSRQDVAQHEPRRCRPDRDVAARVGYQDGTALRKLIKRGRS